MTFYNKNGEPIAYLSDDIHIYLFSGEPVAYLSNDAIFNFDGKHLGWFENGWVFDLNGERVFFTENSSGGHMKPMKSIKEMKSSSWSSLSEKAFFNL